LIPHKIYNMKNLFETNAYNEILQRLDKLTPASQRQWGKMDVSQMMAHCSEPLYIALGDKQGKRTLMGFLFGKIAKKSIVGEQPFKRSLPTAKEFLVSGQKDFNAEKEKLKGLINRFYAAKDTMPAVSKHFFFGEMTAAEWSQSTYKHLDHHLQQFGV
jgi:hypothetical protein